MRRCNECFKFLTHFCPLKAVPEPDDCECVEFESREDARCEQAEIRQTLKRERS